MGNNMTNRSQIGAVIGTHGLKGEVKVYPTTQDPERFRRLEHVFLTDRTGEHELTVESVKFVGALVALKFSGLDSIEQVQNFRHAELFVDRKDAIPLKEGEYYIPDLIGLSVLDEKEQTVGKLTDVLKTAANDVYEVTKPDGTTVLLPAIPECILEVKPEEGVMHVFMMPGL